MMHTPKRPPIIVSSTGSPLYVARYAQKTVIPEMEKLGFNPDHLNISHAYAHQGAMARYQEEFERGLDALKEGLASAAGFLLVNRIPDKINPTPRVSSETYPLGVGLQLPQLLLAQMLGVPAFILDGSLDRHATIAEQITAAQVSATGVVDLKGDLARLPDPEALVVSRSGSLAVSNQTISPQPMPQ